MTTYFDHTKLTASELAVLFGSYTDDALAICMLSYFAEHVEDPEIKACVEYGLELSKMHVEIDRDIFKKEELPIPEAFTEQDVNITAPRLYSDELILNYVQNLGIMGLRSYSIALPKASRKSLREQFTHCLQSSAELYNRTTELSIQKGAYVRPPMIPYPQQNEFVQKQHFLAGWMGEQRPLTSIEISLLFMNLYRNSLGSALLTGFAQVAQSQKVQKHMTRGAEISKHHSAVFAKFLSESNIPAPTSGNFTVMTTTDPIFSDKLIMYHTSALQNAGIGFYGESMGGSQRKDLTAAYGRLIMEAGEYSLDGANIMIDNGWFEKPPSAPDRRELTKG
ncbi:DUF3231 family protein [Lederbergia sp. NSJ-179]|uniref:DUF3231 family protein n=1 Tax=Lederbergia sp. NSJ-179 TaxID=2931402 RepID=UPI001FD0B5DF|nr:DUF3231 family protein [Lederbergia sp. NSJ-179]MCJ7842595.1 DUF3231 family protein [Lederbergia sp. NSJ-179]